MPIDTDTRSNSFTSLLPSVNPTTWRRHRKQPWVDPWSLGMWGESLHHLSVDVPEKMAHDIYGLLWIMSFINSKCHYHTYYYDVSTISLYKSWTNNKSKCNELSIISNAFNIISVTLLTVIQWRWALCPHWKGLIRTMPCTFFCIPRASCGLPLALVILESWSHLR